MNKNNTTGLLNFAGILTILLAVFQAVITTVPSWAFYFGAGEDVTSKIWLLYLSGFFVSLVFVLFALYAFSAAGKFKPMPFTKTMLISISIIFTLRGLVLFVELLANSGIINVGEVFPVQAVISSGVSLGFGLLYIAGIVKSWKYLPGNK